MTNQTATVEALIEENAILKRKVEKLTRELSMQLEDNVDYVLAMSENLKRAQEATEINRLLLSVGKVLEDRYRVMAENIDEIVSILDIRGRYIFVNQNAAALHGYEIGDMIGKSIFGVMNKETGEVYRHDIFNPVIRENRRVISSIVFNKGDRVMQLETHCQPILDEKGQVIGVLNITRDRTAEKKQADYIEIEHSINLVTSLSDGLEQTVQDIFFKFCQADCLYAGGLYLFDEEKQSLDLLCCYNLPDTFVNSIRSLGVNSPQYEIVSRGVPQYEIFPELIAVKELDIEETGKKIVSVIPLVHENQIVGSLNFILNNPEQITTGDKLFLETIAWRIARIIGLHDAQLKLNKTVAALNETISDLKVKQQILIQKSKMESLGELSAGMAHEINQPLMIISLAIENISQKMARGKKNLSITYLQRKFDSVLMNVNRIKQIIDNMRIFARDQSNITFKKINIGELFTKTMEMVGVQYRAEGIKIITDNVDVKAHVIGNIFKLEQVLLNLLSNSRYALREKSIRPDMQGFLKQIEMKAVRAGNHLILEISDNGIGIPEDHIEKLFTPFFTTKREGAGTGLGLSIAYGILKEMNGEITVTSKVNEFTKIRIVLQAV